MKKNETELNDPHVVLAGPATDLDLPEENGLQLHEETLPMQTVSIDNIADLENAEVAPVDLMSEYWTPVNVGEQKRVIFDKIDITPVLSNDGTGEIIDLECAFFLVNDNGSAKRICNGSKRLVGSLQSANVKHGMPLQITYLGKKQNASNGFKSDNWSVKPLVLKTK